MNDLAASHFLSSPIMAGGDWFALERAVVRLMLHCGWRDVQHIGGAGDKGADILAVRKGVSYLVQVKAVSSASYVGKDAIDQAIKAQAHYESRVVVAATNGEFTRSAYARRDELKRAGYAVELWNGEFFLELASKCPAYSAAKPVARDYQRKIADDIVESHNDGRRKAFFVLATGLGKTVIASDVVDRLYRQGLKKVLVLCHARDLAQQLQQSFWAGISKSVSTTLFMDGRPPAPVDGVNFGLYQTLYNYLGGINRDAFDLIVVDEAHHALANAFSACMEHLRPRLLVGMTATPWRGDGLSVESVFGEPMAQISLLDGMRMGYLAKVNYQLMCDNIKWDEISRVSRNAVTIRDLNKRLFIPQRDEAIIKQILDAAKNNASPRIAVFSPSRSHAAAFARKLTASGISAVNLSVDDKVARRRNLMKFAEGAVKAAVAVDILNEGVDVPEVNMLVFLRATHSRRIFVQQLGRGLRVSKGKDEVVVLDFVTDIRRIAAVQELDKDARAGARKGEAETVCLRDGVVTFSDEKARSFIDAWLEDVANLQDQDAAAELKFPNFG